MNDETNQSSWLQHFRFLITPDHPCSYLDDREAITLFVDPTETMNADKYSRLAQLGFRRSGEHVYRPHCTLCNECKLVRVRAKDFVFSRSQQRILRKNRELKVKWLDAVYEDEHFALYQKYMRHRHPDSSMADDDPLHYTHIMKASWCPTRLAEFRLHGRLIAIAITDWLENGLSAVYTYFEPELASHSLGTFAILSQINTARDENLDYVYLGYWIQSCQKMSYKIRFNALEIFNGHGWQQHPS